MFTTNHGRFTHVCRRAIAHSINLDFVTNRQLPPFHQELNLILPHGMWKAPKRWQRKKYDQLITLQIHLMAVQKTKSDSSYMFRKSGWEILHSSTPAGKHHGVGLFVSPKLRPHVSNFLAHSTRICEITLNVHPHLIQIFSIYATSTVEDSQEDVERKFDFWECLDSIIDDN